MTTKNSKRALVNYGIFALVAVLVIFIDRITKAYFNATGGQVGHHGTMVPSGAVPFKIDGIVQFRLLYNYGAAWGSFNGMTIALVVVTSLICVGILAILVVTASKASKLEVFSLALVFAGGIGNLIDRVTRGYVIDFIEPIFISFPTFNVADIGITCGFALFFLATLMNFLREKKTPAAQPAQPAPSTHPPPAPADQSSAEGSEKE